MNEKLIITNWRRPDWNDNTNMVIWGLLKQLGVKNIYLKWLGYLIYFTVYDLSRICAIKINYFVNLPPSKTYPPVMYCMVAAKHLFVNQFYLIWGLNQNVHVLALN